MAAAPAADPLPFDLEPGDPPNPTRAVPGRRSPRPSCPSASPPTARGGCSSTPTGAPAPQTRAEAGLHRRRRRVDTSVPDFEPFFGTSAAAPHAAAIAALVLSGNPAATDRRRARGVRRHRARPRARRRRRPHRPRHPARRQRARATPARRRSRWCRPRAADGHALDRRRRRLPRAGGDGARCAMPVTNVGDGTATGISARRHHAATPPVTITPRTRAYGDLPPGATRVARLHGSRWPPSYPLGKRVRSRSGSRSPACSRRRTATFKVGDRPARHDAGDVRLHRPAGADPGRRARSARRCRSRSPASATPSNITFSIDGTDVHGRPGRDHRGHRPHLRRRPHGHADLARRHDRAAVPAPRRDGQQPLPGRVRRRRRAAVRVGAGRRRPVHRAPGGRTTRWRRCSTTPVDGTWTFKVTDGAAADTGSMRAVHPLTDRVRAIVR